MNSAMPPRTSATIHRQMMHKPDSALFSSGRRITFLGLSLANLLICAVGGVLHYSNLASGNPAQVAGWLLSMFFLLLAFSPRPRDVASNLRTSLNWKTLLFVFWILVFAGSRLWHFRTAPWNGDALFDESGWDLYFLKHYVIGHPYQAAWFHGVISRETLFHYYVWAFLHCFGYNILSYEAALFVIWCVTFVFTLLLVDLFFGSIVVTSVTALVFNFLPFAFIYTFAGYRYPMATALCVGSLYFLHRGFRTASALALSLGGIMAGLCLASSISGKQYLLVLFLFGIIYAAFHWKLATANLKWAIPIIGYSCLTAAMPILCYIAFTQEHYALYESGLIRDFWQSAPGSRAKALWDCFFSLPGPRFFINDALPIPLPYYCFLLPDLFLALWRKRYEIVLLAVIPVIGAFVAKAYENRLLLAIPFWIILMGFAFAGIIRVKLHPGLKTLLWSVCALLIAAGLTPSVRFIYKQASNPFTISNYAQHEVAVSRFLRDVVAGRKPANPPHRERDEFNRIPGIPDPPYDTLICQKEAYSIIHLFLHDYDDEKILGFCADLPIVVSTEQEIWTANRKTLSNYVPGNKDLKLIWEHDPKTERIIRTFRPFRDLGTEESLSYTFAGKQHFFYILNIDKENILQFQDQVRALPYSIH